MKRENVMAVVLLVCSAAPAAAAWIHPGNPDAIPSVGFRLEQTELNGKRFEEDQPGQSINRVQGGPEQEWEQAYGFDVRLPVSNSVTFSVFGDRVEKSTWYKRTDGPFSNGQIIYKQSANLDGWRYGFSVRLYLNK